MNRVFVRHCFCFPVLGLSSKSQSTHQQTRPHTRVNIGKKQLHTCRDGENPLLRQKWAQERIMDTRRRQQVDRLCHQVWPLELAPAPQVCRYMHYCYCKITFYTLSYTTLLFNPPNAEAISENFTSF